MQNAIENPLFKNLEFLVAGEKSADGKEGDKKEEVSFTQEQIEASLRTPVETKEEVEGAEKVETNVIQEIKDNGIKPEAKKEESEENKEEDKPEEKTEVYTALSDLFKEEGLVDKDFKSKDELLTVFSEKVSAEANELLESEIASRPDEIKELIKNWKEGVPLDELIKTKSNQMRYSAIDDAELAKNEDLQKEVYTQYLKETTRYSEDKIKKEVARLMDLGALAEEVKEAKKELIEAEKEYEKNLVVQARKERQEEEIKNRELVNQIHKKVKEVKEIIPGIKVTEKEADELFKNITTAVELRDNQPISLAMQVREKDPITFDITLNYLIKQGVFNGDWSKIVAKAETKAVSKLEKQLEDTVQKAIRKSGNSAETPEKDKGKNVMAGLEFAIKNINKR